MSWLSKGLKKVGGLAEKAAPVVGLIPGVGTLAGGAIGGLGALAHGDGLRGALKYGAMGAASGLAGSKLLGGKGILGVPGALKKVIGSGGHPEVVGLGPGGVPMINQTAGKSGLGGLGGIAGLLGSGFKKIGGVDGLLGAGALGYGAYQQKQAGDYRNKALKMIEQDYASREPLRKMGLAGMLNETPPDLSGVFQSQNPLRRVA